MFKIEQTVKQQIAAPEFGDGLVHREQLVDLLHSHIHRKLIAIGAPAGYGKSTLLADFIAHTDIPVVWVQVTELDADPARLARVVWISLSTRFRRIRDMVNLGSMSGSSPRAYARAVIGAVEERIHEGFVLALDDVHNVADSEEAVEFLDELVLGLPENATVITSGRELPEISLAMLMAEGQLQGIGPREMSLSRLEVSDLLSRLNPTEGFSDEQIDLLHASTRGWVTGVLLSARVQPTTISQLADTPQSLVYEYLTSVVLNRQPSNVREFLLGTSLMPFMTGPMCSSVLDLEDAEDLLGRIYSEGLFISIVQTDPVSYEYHPQFREFLRTTILSASPEKASEIQLGISKFLNENGDYEAAVQVLLDGAHYSDAIQIVEENAARLSASGMHRTILEWSDVLEHADGNSAQLDYEAAIILFNQGKLEHAKAKLKRVLETSDETENVGIRARALAGLIEHRSGSTTRALEQVSRLLSSLDNDVDPVASSYCKRILVQITSSVPGNLEDAEMLIEDAIHQIEGVADTELEQLRALQTLTAVKGRIGKELEARRAAIRAHSIVERVGSPYSLASSHNNMAMMWHQAGDYGNSLEHYTQALKYANRAASRYFEAFVYLGQADLFTDMGLTIQAARLYEQAIEIGSELEDNRVLRYACYGTGVLHRRWTGNTVAIEWFRRSEEFDEDDEWGGRYQVQLASLECEVAPAKALARLSAIEDSVSLANLLPEDKVGIALWKGCAFLSMDQSESARVAIQDMLETAATAGATQLVAAELNAKNGLVRRAMDLVGSSAVIDQIEERIGSMSDLARSSRPPEEALVEVRKGLKLVGLGTVEVHAEEQKLDGIKPLDRELLFYLVDNGNLNRDKAGAVFWGDHPPGRQTANLQMAIYNLRLAIGKDSIQLDGNTYLIDSNFSVAYDVANFERAAQVAERLLKGDPRRYFALTEAISLYKGEFGPQFESEWAHSRRRILEARYLDLVSQQADEAIVRNDPERAIQRMREALLVEPLRDDLNIKYMQLLGLLNQRSEIVKHYQEFVQMLDAELGLDPSEEIRELYVRLIS